MLSKTISSPLYQLGWAPNSNRRQKALPLFVGYTEKAAVYGEIVEVHSLSDFEQQFGYAPQPAFQIEPHVERDYTLSRLTSKPYHVYASVQLFFAEQNGPCQVLSVGQYGQAVDLEDFRMALSALPASDFSVLLAPDASLLSDEKHESFEQLLGDLYQQEPHSPSLVRETVSLYPWCFKKEKETALPTSGQLPHLAGSLHPITPSVAYIKNSSTLIELLLWEAGQYLKEKIITERRYAKLRHSIIQLSDSSKDLKSLQAELLPRSPLLQDILDEMAFALSLSARLE